MKKVPLLFIVSCLSFAAASQQNDFVNIQDLLKKKAKEKKPVAKPLVFIKPSLQNFNLLQPQEMMDGSVYSHTLANGDKVFILPQDNMPYIKSEINRFDISNGYKEKEILSPFIFFDKKAGIIPNASIPPKIFLSR